MANRSTNLSLCVVTPTFRREPLLHRFLKRIRKQTYPDWKLVVVHDGPSPLTQALVARFRALDPRIEYMHTATWTNDMGVSPRHEGVKHVLEGKPPDYCLFWDDDNYFALDALERVADALEANGQPDLLIVSMRYRSRVLPPRDVLVSTLIPGHIDMASLVMRSPLALAAYADLVRQKKECPEKCFYTQDYMVFDHIRRQSPAVRIGVATDVLVGLHDGLRWKPYIRHLLGIPPLDLANRLR